MVTGLKPFQQIITKNTLYAVRAGSPNSLNRAQQASAQLQPSIEIISSGHGDVYGSQVFADSPPTGMTKMISALQGLQALTLVPNYLYVDSSDTVTIVVSGVVIEAPAYDLAATGLLVLNATANLVLDDNEALAATGLLALNTTANLTLDDNEALTATGLLVLNSTANLAASP